LQQVGLVEIGYRQITLVACRGNRADARTWLDEAKRRL
jgi:hypothetical protein